jgi:soluble lytic murein transglycosylase
MRKTVPIIIIAVLAAVSLFYFDIPFNLLRPMFHTDTIKRYAGQYGLDPLFVTAVIKVESKFFRQARSHRGAIGLMQLLPSTAHELAGELGYRDFSDADLEDPNVNINLGMYYLYKLKKEYNDNEILALAAYNAGTGKVQSWYRVNPLLGVEIGDIPYRETRAYVRSVMRTYRWLKTIQKNQKPDHAVTPLMQQYREIKAQHPGMILFFRLGDFYEMFGEDARKASAILEVVLTQRQGMPMCGIPHHAVNAYLKKLIKAGEKGRGLRTA